MIVAKHANRVSLELETDEAKKLLSLIATAIEFENLDSKDLHKFADLTTKAVTGTLKWMEEESNASSNDV